MCMPVSEVQSTFLSWKENLKIEVIRLSVEKCVVLNKRFALTNMGYILVLGFSKVIVFFFLRLFPRKKEKCPRTMNDT